METQIFFFFFYIIKTQEERALSNLIDNLIWTCLKKNDGLSGIIIREHHNSYGKLKSTCFVAIFLDGCSTPDPE